MVDVRIGHLRTRYRMPADAVSERSRLDRVLQSAFDDELFDAALERAGIPASEEICVRRMDSVVRLERSQPDARLAVAWSVALADAIAQCVRDGGPDVIRYRTRYAAIVDMLCSATRGDVERAWAWRSLGIWRAEDAIDVKSARIEVIVALTREPRLAPSALTVLARRGLLPMLVVSVPTERWVALARAALSEFGASIAAMNERFGEMSTDLDVVDEAVVDAALSRIASSSPLVRFSVAQNIDDRAGRSHIARAIAAMALLESEPSLAASVIGREVVLRLAHHVARSSDEASSDRRVVASGRDAAATRDAQNESRVNADERRRAEATRDETLTDEQQIDVDVRATTSWGGLLFLLHIASALDLPTTLLRHDTLGTRSLRWSLHQLVMQLVPIADDDPAALAFAGVAPRARVPSADEPPPSDADVIALRELHDAIVADLRARMKSGADEESDAALIQRVAKRNAEIVAEAAWMEIRLASAELSTDVRRAGLDLDPGWIPWLGVVVRFVYV